MTQLCALPTCRIRGRHLPACQDDGCTGCLPRVADEGLVCSACEARAERQLAEILRLLPDARLVAAGLVRRGTGGGSGKPASRPPLNVDAVDALDAVTNVLTTICRDIAETRGAHFVSTAFEGHRVADPLAEACSWLSGQMQWLRHAVDAQGVSVAVDVMREIAESAARMRGIVEGPREQKYLGPCGAETREDTSVWDGERYWEMSEPGPPCDGDVYGVPGAEKGRCRTCGATVDQGERRAWLDDVVRSYAYRANEIANAYGINANTIRTWAHNRPALYDHAGNITRPARPAVLRTHSRDRDGRPLFLLGDVLDLAAEAAAKREEARAIRERRREGATA